MQPQRPTNLPAHAALCLEALATSGLGHAISLGGALGLLHYLDYRPTHDVDAWWQPAATRQDRQRVVETIEHTLSRVGDVRLRTWGEVVSIELRDGDQTVFTFQIAERSVELLEPQAAPWVDVLLDSFDDLVASKMVALVERGAPRDFRDIYALCQAGLTAPAECWRLWRERQARAGLSTNPRRARLAVETHLARIGQHRPLSSITDRALRNAAQEARAWYREELLNALMALTALMD